MIIGLTGRIASGKGETAEYFKKKGFEYYTISQMVRELTSKLEGFKDALKILGKEK